MAPPSDKTTQAGSSGTDVACTHCRERKIKCDRARPSCSNCKRDSAECGYQTPGKRVNHIKLLCNNVGGLGDRLVNVEGTLERVVAAFENAGLIGRVATGTTSPRSPASSSGSEDSPDAANAANTPVERYRGPLSLSAHCRTIQECVVSIAGPMPADREDTEGPDELGSLVIRLRENAEGSQAFPHQQGGGFRRLPPKQFILQTQAQFFEQADHVTDIFVQDNFLANLERVYSSPARHLDEPWAICFQAMILLAVGSVFTGANNNDHMLRGLAGSFLLPNCSAFVNSRLLTAPRLINVQALILLSTLAQQQDSHVWSETLFAQACYLAKSMGLHDLQPLSNGSNPVEHEERWKVFRALFARDRGAILSRGSTCWLPDYRAPPPPPPGSTLERNTGPRLDLARIQDKIYRIGHTKQWRRTSKKLHSTLANIELELDTLAETHNILDASDSDTQPILQLDFLATRIGAFQDSPLPSHERLVCSDARASCLVLLHARGDNDPTFMTQYNTLVSTNTPARSATPRRTMSVDQSSLPAQERSMTPLRFLRLLETFPASAFFVLGRLLITSNELNDDTQAESDLALLSKIQACYHENAAIMPAGSYSRKLGSTFATLLQIVRVIRQRASESTKASSSQGLTPGAEQELSNPAPAATPADLSEALKAMQPSMNVDMADFSAWPTPNSLQDLPWDNWPELAGSGDASNFTFQSQADTSMPDFFDSLSASEPQELSWAFAPPAPTADMTGEMGRKRRRTDDDFVERPSQGLAPQSDFSEFLTSPDSLFFQYGQGNSATKT